MPPLACAFPLLFRRDAKLAITAIRSEAHQGSIDDGTAQSEYDDDEEDEDEYGDAPTLATPSVGVMRAMPRAMRMIIDSVLLSNIAAALVGGLASV